MLSDATIVVGDLATYGGLAKLSPTLLHDNDSLRFESFLGII